MYHAVTTIGLVATVERTPPGQVRHALMNDLRLSPGAASREDAPSPSTCRAFGRGFLLSAKNTVAVPAAVLAQHEPSATARHRGEYPFDAVDGPRKRRREVSHCGFVVSV